MADLSLDLKQAARALLAGRLTTLAAIVSLGLGIGGTTAMFTVVDGVLFRALPFEDSHRLVRVWETSPQSTSRLAAPANFVDWRREARTLEGLAAMFDSSMSLVDGAEPAQIRVVSVSANLFAILRARPLHGRLFRPGEDAPGSERAVVLGAGLWRRRYGSDPAVVGRQVTLGGQPATIVGVAPDETRAAAAYVTFTPAETAPDVWLLGRKGIPEGAPVPGDQSLVRDAHYLGVVARLAAGVSMESSQVEMSTIASRLERAYPDTNARLGVRLEPLKSAIVGESSTALLLMLGAVVFLLLIASANLASLTLVRATARERELAMRHTLGASRAALVRQMLVESLLLAFMGGALGIAVAAWGVEALLALAPANLPRLDEVALDGRALGVALLVSAGTGLMFGLWPALRASRPEPLAALRTSGRGTESRRHGAMLQALVVGELAIAQVLLVGGGLLLVSFARTLAVDPGFDPHGVLVATVDLASSKASSPERKAQLITGVLERLASLPGVERVASTLTPPMSPAVTRGVRIEGRPEPRRGETPSTAFRTASDDFFSLARIRMVGGRAFDRTDTASSEPVAIVNESFVRHHFGGADALGRRVGLHRTWRRVVGIVADTRQRALDREPQPEIYVPVRQDAEPWSAVSFLVRTPGDPASFADAVRRAVLAVDADQPLSRVETLDHLLAGSLAAQRFALTLASVFGGMALLLAAVGTFGVMSYSVVQRTREFGIRIALGARNAQVLRQVLGRSGALTLVAVSGGLMAGLAVGRSMEHMLYRVSPAEPLALLVSGATLAAVSLLASYLPVRRALAGDPVASLKTE
jgi:predicted permease